MHTRLFFATTLLVSVASAPVFGARAMYISLCNNAGVPEKIVAQARQEVEVAFEAAKATVHWVSCQGIESAKDRYGELLFVIRLRGDRAWFAKRSVSLDTMGRAYTEERGSGYLADAYMPSIVKFSEEHDIDVDTLLGLVMAHELGHLVLGPGHSEDGIMFGQWTWRETEAGRKRWLRFNHEQAAVIAGQLARRAN